MDRGRPGSGRFGGRAPFRADGFRLLRRIAPTAAFLAALLAPAGPSLAVDGRIEVRATAQEGRAGDESYRTETRREEASALQRIDLAARLWMQAQFRALREVTDSRFQGVDSDFEYRTWQPGLALGFATKKLRIGANVDAYRRESESSAGEGPATERLTFGGSANYRDGGSTRLGVRWEGVESTREEPAGEQRVRESVLSLQAARSVENVGRFRYQYSQLANDARTRDVRTTHRTHGLEYSGDRRFAGERGNVFVRARSQFFTQEVRRGESGAPEEVYLLPLVGRVVLDDTPEVLDLLEEEGVEVAALFDRERGVATTIDLGDEAPPVREFGGDYRNIEFDFGETVGISSAFLYVDRILLNPELFTWRVFATEDPEGRLWDEIAPSSYSIAYREEGTGLQGWEVVFAERIAARFFKLVDVKVGPSVPNLFVTELEVRGPGEGDAAVVDEWTNTHRVDGSVGYLIASSLRVRYDGSYRQRDYSEETRNLVERSHGLAATFEAWRFILSGQYGVHTLGSPTRQNIDVDHSLVSLQRAFRGRFSTTAAWSRTLDRSGSRDRTTDSYTFSAEWRIAPALVLDQRVTEGRLEDRAEGRRSSSTSLVTGLRAEPVRTFSVDLERTDRWVDREAGSGFVRFNDTAITLAWTPLPRISVHSLFRYEERDGSDWIVQQLFQWEPLAGGDVRPRFTLNHFRDTRNETEQKGAGLAIVWRVRPRLTIEGNGDVQDLRFEGASNRPTNGGVRVALTF